MQSHAEQSGIGQAGARRGASGQGAAAPDMSPSEAASRLRYMAGVRERARRAVLLPAFVALALGGIVVTHGALIALWPHAAVLSVAWLACLLVARPGLVWQRRRLERRRGLLGATRLRVACGAAGVVAAVAAVVASADPLVSAAAGSVALAAYLGGVPAVALAALVAGIAGELALVDGAPRPAGELLVGAGLVAAGLACLAMERRSA
jgi:hypothetical protein